MEKKIYLIKFVTSIFAATLLSCSIYHMQTPQTLPPGKWSGGAALSGFGPELFTTRFTYLPGLWVRKGISPRFDIGIHTWMLGLKADGKYNLVEDYLSVGLGLGGGAIWWGIAEYLGSYIVEGSVYLGYPGKVAVPYAVGRMSAFAFGDWASEPVATAVGGLRFNLSHRLALYGEFGGLWFLSRRGQISYSNYTGGIGVSIGY